MPNHDSYVPAAHKCGLSIFYELHGVPLPQIHCSSDLLLHQRSTTSEVAQISHLQGCRKLYRAFVVDDAA